MTSRFKNHINQITAYDLISLFTYKHNLQLPKIVNISVNISDPSLATVKSKILNYIYLVKLITNQTPKETVSRKNKIHLKIKKNSITGCKVDLNSSKSLDLLQYITLFIIPQIKNFSGFSYSEINKNQISIHIRDWYKFIPNNFTNKVNLFNKSLSSIQITIKFKNKHQEEAISIVNSLNFPIK